jgi:hypothetical protein
MKIDASHAHEDDRSLVVEVGKATFEAAKELGLPMRVFEAKRRPYPGGREGVCYTHEGRVSVAFRFREGQQWWTKRLKVGSVLQVAGHELAHLVNPDSAAHHSDEFVEMEKRCVEAVERHFMKEE